MHVAVQQLARAQEQPSAAVGEAATSVEPSTASASAMGLEMLADVHADQEPMSPAWKQAVRLRMEEVEVLLQLT